MLFLCFLIANCSYTFGQSKSDNLRIKYYTLEEGLSQVSCNDLLQDSLGFIWIATQDGLNKFDGKTFKHFKHSESDSTTLSGNLTSKLLQDHKGNIWVGTVGNGLNYYDYENDSFKRIKLKKNNKKNTIITALATDGSNYLWIGSSNLGLSRLDIKDHSSKNIIANESITALYYEDHNNLWAGDLNGGVYHTTPTSLDTPILKGRVQGNVQAFYKTEQGLLIGSYEGLYTYDNATGKTEAIELEVSGNFLTKHVVSFLKASANTVWIATGRGLYLFDWKKNTVLQKIEYQENQSNGLTNNTVQSLLKISPDKIIAGTANGLNLIDFKTSYFQNISKNNKGQLLLNDNVIFSIYKNRMGLWIGTSDGGLNLIHNNKIYYFTDSKNNNNSIAGSVVRAIVEDKQNQRLWIATTRGLSMIDLNTFDPNNPIFRNFYHNHEDSNTINTDFLKDITLDQNNNLWGAAFGYGIFRLELSDKTVKIVRYKHDKNDSNSLINDVTQRIKVDKKNNIWIGTQNGLSKLSFDDNDYSNPTFTNYQSIEGDLNTLSNNSIYDIIVDDNDDLWLGTRKGLNKLNNGTFNSWTAQKQFPNDIVYTIQNDNDGNLWLGTNDGLVKFNPQNESFSHYGIEDGIQSKEFDIHAKFKDEDGTIYVGGIGGVTYFHPNNLKNIDNPIPLYFSQLKVKDQIIKPFNSTSKSLLTHALSKTKEIKFGKKQFPFYLQFSSIDYRLQKNIKYGYKLLPNDEEWNMLTDPEIQFLNLPSGKYTLQVNGFSRGKEWDQAPLEMALKILPSWWATWWAYAIYIGLAILFADRFYRFQLSRKLAVAESTRLKEINLLKNNLYTNITHEFRTPLTVIKGMTDSLKDNIENKKLEETDKHLEMIRRNSDGLLRLVNEMLDLSKLESGNMELQIKQTNVIPFVKYLSESFSSLAQESDISLTIYSEIEELVMDIDVNKLSSIISNVLSNAIKFTPPHGKIVVHLNSVIINQQTFFNIKIKDNGLGIAEEDLKNIFNRFYQIDSSASRAQEGSGIGLALTKEFVELMQGTISVESKPKIGSTFSVQIPVSNNAPFTKEIEIALQDYSKPSTSLISDASKQINTNTEFPLVLIIEDNNDVAYYLKTCLDGKYETLHAINGGIGIEIAFEKIPDIIICDVMMPVKDGFEVCETLKSDERTDHIPIIMLTAKVSIKDRLAGLSHGADAYLAKPFEKAELFTRLEQLISLRKKMLNKFENNGVDQFLKKRVEDPETKFIQKAIKLIHKHISDHAFGSTQLAYQLHLSESQIYRKLKAITGKSTAVFIRTVRLQRAKELILTTDETISEIAYGVGFNDPSWFSRAFKEEFGFSPSAMSN